VLLQHTYKEKPSIYIYIYIRQGQEPINKKYKANKKQARKTQYINFFLKRQGWEPINKKYKANKRQLEKPSIEKRQGWEPI
jgi:hypothetical protein